MKLLFVIIRDNDGDKVIQTLSLRLPSHPHGEHRGIFTTRECDLDDRRGR